jgi:hypothetical protein
MRSTSKADGIQEVSGAVMLISGKNFEIFGFRWFSYFTAQQRGILPRCVELPGTNLTTNQTI